METVLQSFSNLVSLEMFKDFAVDYLRSLKSYAKATFLRTDSIIKRLGGKIDEAAEQFEQVVTPLSQPPELAVLLSPLLMIFYPGAKIKKL